MGDHCEMWNEFCVLPMAGNQQFSSEQQANQGFELIHEVMSKVKIYVSCSGWGKKKNWAFG